MTLRSLLRSVLVLVAVVALAAMVAGRSAVQVTAPASVTAPAAASEDSAETARLLRGLLAYRDGDAGSAIQLLSRPAGALEDWRLLILAESAHTTADPELAEEALAILHDKHPDSPIRALAIQRGAQIAVEHELWESALRWIELARQETLPPEKSKEIEILAWDLGTTLERPGVQSRAARHLLVEHPLAAAELDLESYLRDDSGDTSWSQMLSPSELEKRARRQIDVRQAEAALDTLELVPTSQRSFAWSLLRAEALTRDHRGREALEVLTNLASSDVERQVAIVWQRALAAREAARVRRGRSNLPRSQREEMRALARESLNEVAELAPDTAQRILALKVLFALVSDEDDSFEPSRAILQRLRNLDPNDATGTRYLWRLGWRAYTKRDFPVAIGYWSELEAMYPGTSNARSGRYWTARAHEALGHNSRATDIYRQILSAEADDFYSRHARHRLDEGTRSAAEPPLRPTEPWPDDRVLDRARWLSDAGLSELALQELEGQEAVADPRAFCARKAVVLADLGRRRDSIQSLVCAFPNLGKPQQSSVPDDALRLYYPLDYRTIIEQRARQQNLRPKLVFAMIRQESAFDSQAKSWAGARGLMQLMPATGREMATRLGLRYSTSRLNDPDFSVQLGTRYFRQVLDMFDGNEELALAGYNGGPYRIKKLWRQAGTNAELDRFVEGLSLEETKTYVKRILLFEDSYQRLYAEGG